MPRVRRIVTSRAGGASRPPYSSFNLGLHVGDDPAAVRANRQRLVRATGLAPDQLVWMQQVHGSAVAVVDGPRPSPVPETDGLVTATPGLGLVVLVADCVPVLVATPAAVAAVHAGRAGATAGVLPAVVSALVGAGADLDAADALLGPAICGACYEVPAAMRDEVEAALPGTATTSRRGAPGLDLRAGLARQLTALGVSRVVIDSRCTAEDPELFSHRRDGTTGRQAALTWLQV